MPKSLRPGHWKPFNHTSLHLAARRPPSGYWGEDRDAVTQGQLLGTVGNSGTPSSLLTGKPDTHVHFDLWLGDHYIGQYLRPVETREWLEQILGIDG